MKKIYFDNAATTQISNEVIAVISDVMKNNFGNPSSTHSFGRSSKSLLELSRKYIAEKLNVSPSEIIFTSGGTESNNMVIKSAVESLGIKRIISTKIEHKAVLNSVETISKNKKLSLDFLDVDENGNPDKNQLKELLENSDETTLVSLMHINNEIGTMIDLNEYGELCESNNAFFHSDTVQTIGHYNLDLNKTKIDSITCSAHKFHGPKGVGFIYIKNGTNLLPLIEGGSQERGLRGGTESIHNIAGLKKAFESSYNSLEKDSKNVFQIKEHFISSIKIPIYTKNIFKAYKISKRFDDDISSVCASFNFEIKNKKIKNVKIAFGGMSSIPKRAKYCEKTLENKEFSNKILDKAKESLLKDFSPISDMRASKEYRIEIAKNLLTKVFAEIQNKNQIELKK